MLGVLGITLLVKGAALSFPLWLSSDAEFQANRFDQFLAGEWHPSVGDAARPPVPDSLSGGALRLRRRR